MLYDIKTILHSSRAVLALNGGLMISLGGAFDLARVLHICNVSAYFGNESATTVAVTLRKSWVLVVYLLEWCCFPVRQFKIYCSKITFFLQQVFLCLELCCTQGCLNRQASPYSCLSFSGPCHYYHFLLPPTLPRIIPRQIFKCMSKFKVIRWATDLVVLGKLH